MRCSGYDVQGLGPGGQIIGIVAEASGSGPFPGNGQERTMGSHKRRINIFLTNGYTFSELCRLFLQSSSSMGKVQHSANNTLGRVVNQIESIEIM